MFSKITKRLLAMATALALSATLYAVGGNVYLSTIYNQDGSFQSRSFLTFNKDGTLVVTDSKQQGGSSFSPFGAQQGYWEKDGETLKFLSYNFNYPKYFTCDHPTGNCLCGDGCCEDCANSQQIARVTSKLKKNHHGHWEGPLVVTFFDLKVKDINHKHDGSNTSTSKIVLELLEMN